MRSSKPFLHLHTQFNREIPWAGIDMDFMNLNQAAHGDREFGFIAARLRLERKVVVGHWGDPEVQARIGAWTRAACARRDWETVRIARFGDNMREVAVTEGDKVEAQRRLGFSVNGYGVGDLVAHVDAATDAEVDALIDAYVDEYDVAPSLRPGGDRAASLRDGARIELGLRWFLARRPVHGVHRHLRGPPRPRASCPGLAVQRLMARRLRLRRRGRLEDGGDGPRDEGHDRRPARRRLVHGGLHLPPRPGGRPDPGRPHAGGLPSRSRRAARASRSTRSSIGGKADPVRLVFDAHPGRAVAACVTDMGERFRMVAERGRRRRPAPAAAEAAGRARDVASAPGSAHQRGRLDPRRRVAPHEPRLRGDDRAPRGLRRRCAGSSSSSSTRRRELDEFRDRLRWNDLYHRLSHGL